MRFRLRTLLILLAVLPPLLWFGWTKYEAWRAERELRRARLERAVFHVTRTQDASLELLKFIREAETKNGPSTPSTDNRP